MILNPFLLSEPDRGEQRRDAEGADEGGPRDIQATHTQPQESTNGYSTGHTWSQLVTPSQLFTAGHSWAGHWV